MQKRILSATLFMLIIATMANAQEVDIKKEMVTLNGKQF